MAGHSKWSNIKNRKAAVDAKRGKVFSQIIKKIRISVKEAGSGDPKINPSLKLLIEKARAANMPTKKIQKAIDCALGKSSDGRQVKENIYEGFGPGGAALLVVSFTDNPNRTSSELKYLFSKFNGSLGSPGSVMYMFKRGEGNDYNYICTMPFGLADKKDRVQLEKLIEQLREHDDVEDVYSAVEI
ncbi:MAG: YebC/PmpR family DNA-binding transcriptional regulator [Candidatus Woesebacteria bacterium]|jgi:YebC/PmpR family DNA-binding regulatory protein